MTGISVYGKGENAVQNVKVSVILPVYNMEDRLGCCLDSVVGQSLKEIEVLCCDDGSTDNSLSVLEKYAGQDERIIIFKQPNKGAGPARNKCIDAARGEFMCFIDADDVYASETVLETLYRAAVEKGAAVSCGFLQIDSNGVLEESPLFREFVSDGNETFVDFRDYQYVGSYQCYLFHSRLIKENHIMFPALRRYQDPPFLLQCLDNAKTALFVPINAYVYRYDDSKNNHLSGESVNDLVKGLRWQVEYAVSHKYEKLLQDTIDRINGYYTECIRRNMKGYELEIIGNLLEIDRLAGAGQMVLDILKIVSYHMETMDFARERILCKLHRLEEKVSIGSKLAVYGAGKIGIDVVREIEADSKYSVAVWIDKYKAGQQKGNICLAGMRELVKEYYDYVLIAIGNEDVARQAKQEIAVITGSATTIILWHEL